MCRRIPIWGTYLVNAPDISVSTSWQLLFQVAICPPTFYDVMMIRWSKFAGVNE